MSSCQLIFRHFVACVSKPATVHEIIFEIDIAGENFSSSNMVSHELNYLKAYDRESWKKKASTIFSWWLVLSKFKLFL